MDWRWFNVGTPPWRLFGRRVKLLTLFNRRSTHAHYWGASLLQIGKRHLLAVGHWGVRALFVGQTP
jgi:hypothetical protein